MDAAIAYLKTNEQKHLDWILDFCRFPSVSTLSAHKTDLLNACNWLADRCREAGLESKIMETGGHPAVYAEYISDPAKPTYLVYGHYDVQPTGDLELWNSPPFEPTIHNDWLVCRGAADDKGQLLVHVRAAAAWLQAEGTLPVNLKFLFEGEEEIGSPNLAAFVAKHADMLKCDHILISDTGLYADGWPTVTYGTRGLLYKEIRLFGPERDLHSGSFGGVVANPADVLAKIVASLHDDDGRITIPGFYDDVAQTTPEEREQFKALAFDEDAFIEEVGSTKPFGETGFTTNERRWIRPALDCNGIYGGFMAEGANTIVPKSAGAKISMRLVPNQNAEKLSKQFDEAIQQRCPDTVRLEILNHGHADAYMTPLDSKPMAAAKEALEAAFGKTPAFVREGGSLPILPMFRQVLGADALMMGLASPTCNAHGPNEKVLIPDLNRGAEAAVRLIGLLGQ